MLQCAKEGQDFILDAQHKLDDHHKKILRKHAKDAHDQGVKNVHLMLANSDSAGEMICVAAKEKKIDTIVIGRRGMGFLSRLLLGSVSRYVLENAVCDVIVVKQEHGPEVQHDSSKAQAKQAEEIERERRIENSKQEDAEEEKQQKFHSALDRNIARVAEEGERQRRIKELDERHKREQIEREQELKRIKQAEEEERQRRIKVKREKENGGLIFFCRRTQPTKEIMFTSRKCCCFINDFQQEKPRLFIVSLVCFSPQAL